MKKQISSDIISLFNRTASKSMESSDKLIMENRYLRGEVFCHGVTSMIPKDGRILDYGCGRGRISKMICENGYNVDAMDPSIESLNDAAAHSAGEKGISFKLLTGFGETLADDAYDGIVCSSVIEFVEDVPTLMSNFFRALKPGAALLISFSNRKSLWRAYARWRFGEGGQHFAIQKNEWSPGEFRSMLKSAGFNHIGIEQYLEPPFVKSCLSSILCASRYLGTLGFATARRKN